MLSASQKRLPSSDTISRAIEEETVGQCFGSTANGHGFWMENSSGYSHTKRDTLSQVVLYDCGKQERSYPEAKPVNLQISKC